MKLILDNAIDDIDLITANEMKNLDDTEMNKMMQEGKVKFERIKKSLDEFEMNELEKK